MKKYWFVFIIISTLCFSQKRKYKTYIGFEPIMWYKDKNGNDTNAEPDNPEKKWFHKNIIRIKKDSIFLKRIPVIRIGNKTFYSASDGGFYYYKGIIIKKNNEIKIDLTEINCDYCPTEVSENKNEIIPKRKLYGMITENGIVINNVIINKIEFSKY
ncbi:MAG: hypothetical protein RL108_768 [Bacteroidota bacterium]|jgi:hypothetical protein